MATRIDVGQDENKTWYGLIQRHGHSTLTYKHSKKNASSPGKDSGLE